MKKHEPLKPGPSKPKTVKPEAAKPPPSSKVLDDGAPNVGTLKLGQPKPKPEAAAPEVVKLSPPQVLDDEALKTITLKELRTAYQEFRVWHQNHRCEELIGLRTEEALRRTRAAGKKTGGPVELGYSAGADRVLHPNKRERQIMKIAKQQREQHKSLRAIATYLEEKGFLARNNKKFAASQIKRLIERAGTFTTEDS